MDTDKDLGGRSFAQLIETMRGLQSTVSVVSNVPADVIDTVNAELESALTALQKHEGPESEQWAGRRRDLAARGSILLPPYVIDSETPTESFGRVTFPRFYLGGGAAAHGGTQPLLFDDILGALINRVRDGARVRTAYLHVNYRRITPLDVELRLDAKVDRVEGRKTFATGRILDADGTVLCDAEALFLVLLPGQQ